MIAVTGAAGLLGTEIISYAKNNNISAISLTRKELDFTNNVATQVLFERIKPEVIIHCGAYSKVDLAESERKACFEANVVGTKNIIEACKKIDAKLLYISTDYVFDGNKDGYYTEEDDKNPISVYGKSKSEAEDEIINNLDKYFIVRTSWLFGKNGKNFVDTIIKLSENNSSINVVSDQYGSPTYTKDLTRVIFELIKTEKYGIINVTNSGECSWADFAEKIIELTGSNCTVNRVNTEEYGAKAHRPYNSKLSKKKLESLGIKLPPDWKVALKNYINEKQER